LFFYKIGHFVGPFVALCAMVSLVAFIFAADETAARAWMWTLRWAPSF
jgi:hypothetical protein